MDDRGVTAQIRSAFETRAYLGDPIEVHLGGNDAFLELRDGLDPVWSADSVGDVERWLSHPLTEDQREVLEGGGVLTAEPPKAPRIRLSTPTGPSQPVPAAQVEMAPEWSQRVSGLVLDETAQVLAGGVWRSGFIYTDLTREQSASADAAAHVYGYDSAYVWAFVAPTPRNHPSGTQLGHRPAGTARCRGGVAVGACRGQRPARAVGRLECRRCAGKLLWAGHRRLRQGAGCHRTRPCPAQLWRGPGYARGDHAINGDCLGSPVTFIVTVVALSVGGAALGAWSATRRTTLSEHLAGSDRRSPMTSSSVAPGWMPLTMQRCWAVPPSTTNWPGRPLKTANGRAGFARTHLLGQSPISRSDSRKLRVAAAAAVRTLTDVTAV